MLQLQTVELKPSQNRSGAPGDNHDSTESLEGVVPTELVLSTNHSTATIQADSSPTDTTHDAHRLTGVV